MARGRSNGAPTYRKHHDKRGGRTARAFVVLDGKRIYLGDYNSPASRRAYDRIVSDWLASGRRKVPKQTDVAESSGDWPTIAEVVEQFLAHARSYYRTADGKQTGEAKNLEWALEPLMALFPRMTTDLFRVRSLEAVRQLMIDSGVSRKVVNQRVGCIRRMFKWAEAKELTLVGTTTHLMTLAHLKPGRSEAKERDSVEPVEWERVQPTLFHLSEKLRAMVLFQWWTGARPGEVRVLRGEEIDRTNDVWL